MVAGMVSRAMKLAAEIEDQGEILSDNIKMARVVRSLMSRYKNFKTVWYNMKEGCELNHLLAKLKLEEDQMNKTSESETSGDAFNINFKKKKRESGNKSVSKLKKIRKCRNCHKYGHWERECPNKKEKEEKSKSDDKKGVKSDNKAPVKYDFIVTIDIVTAKDLDIWLVVSGALKHLSPRRIQFVDYHIKARNLLSLQMEGDFKYTVRDLY